MDRIDRQIDAWLDRCLKASVIFEISKPKFCPHSKFTAAIQFGDKN